MHTSMAFVFFRHALVFATVACLTRATESSANVTTTTTTTTLLPPGVGVHVLGQSGKMSIFNKVLGPSKDPNTVVVEFDALKELDSSGNTVGTSGSTKHSINTFAAQSFTITDPVEVTYDGMQADKITFETEVSTIGSLRIDTYVFHSSGVVGPDGGWNVTRGDMKWNIVFKSWSWCGCSKGQGTETGAFIDVDIKIKGRSSEAVKKDSASNLFSLGGGVDLQLTDKVTLDGSMSTMPSGYPKVAGQGTSQVFTFRFPKFTSSALYDPLLSTGSSDSLASTSTSTTIAVAKISGSPMTTGSKIPMQSILVLLSALASAFFL